MRVLVDTSVWSLAFRKRAKSEEELAWIALLADLVRDLKVELIGPVRQELLSGISRPESFLTLKEKLAIFTDMPLLSEDYVSAAECSNACRVKGVQGSHTDFLICAVALRCKLAICTLDQDFHCYKKYLPLTLIGP